MPNSENLSDKSPNSKFHIIALAVSALGIVFGDLGTSPLYTINECFHGFHAIEKSPLNILGVVSLIFWTLTIVVTIKYVTFIINVDNKGEGGIFALLGLIPSEKKLLSAKSRSAIVIAAIIGASLLYGDGVITPAISVLSAIEGLTIATTAMKPFVVPLTCIVLFSLFFFQYRGTGHIGKIFGPIMIIWFLVIGFMGLNEILKVPEILKAINPIYAIDFFAVHKLHGIVVLGSVVLCITGGEALYADLGHFGHSSIRLAWFSLAYPALILNYFGQGAFLLSQPDISHNPFYTIVPRFFLYPMVAISTMATIIASQALISGVFSLTQQAVQLGYCPRMRITHTSSEKEGQIYIPGVNYALMVACLAVVLLFKSSIGLAGAYGIAVTGTMGITSIMYYIVITRRLKWSLWKALPLVSLFLIFDLSYFCGNLPKIKDGGWFTIMVAIMVAVLMMTWKQGRKKLFDKLIEMRFPLDLFLQDIARTKPYRVDGAAVFMTVSPIGTPPTLLHQVKHNKVLHEKVILLSIKTLDIPSVSANKRLTVEDLGQGFFRVLANYGFMEFPNIPEIMSLISEMGVKTDPATTTYFLGRETLLTTGNSRMMKWRKALFAFMSRNASNPTIFFGIPPNRVIELGTQIEL